MCDGAGLAIDAGAGATVAVATPSVCVAGLFVSRSSESLIFGRAGFIARSDLDPVSANLALDFRVEV